MFFVNSLTFSKPSSSHWSELAIWIVNCETTYEKYLVHVWFFTDSRNAPASLLWSCCCHSDLRFFPSFRLQACVCAYHPRFKAGSVHSKAGYERGRPNLYILRTKYYPLFQALHFDPFLSGMIWPWNETLYSRIPMLISAFTGVCKYVCVNMR